MRISTLIPLSGLFAFILLGTADMAAAQSTDFIVSQNGKPVGSASFTFTAKPDGIDSVSLIRVEMQGLNYALSKEERLSPTNGLLHVQLNAIINSAAVNVVAKPEGTQILLNISANGRANTTRLDGHPSSIFLADFDPGALQTLLNLAAAGNNRDLWAIIPKQAGTVSPIQLATYRDEQGTLDAKPVTVHHLVATIAGATTEIFVGPDNQLVQAELPQQGFALVRKGFVLTPPAKPIAPTRSDQPDVQKQ